MKNNRFIIMIGITIFLIVVIPGMVSAQTMPPTPAPTPIGTAELTPIPTCLPLGYQIYGYVRDINTNNPISGATVTASTSMSSISSQTDENGYYEVQASVCTTQDSVIFHITAPGYEDLTETHGDGQYFDFYLTPVSETPLPPTPTPTSDPGVTCQPLAYSASGYVTDIETSIPVSGAIITVDATIGTTTTVTDSAGYYNVAIMSCMLGDSATFTITADGYLDLVATYGIGQVNTIDFELAKVCVLGDVNGDGLIDIVDALLNARYYVGLIVLPYICAADVNCDGAIDIIDALLIAQYYVGLITSFC